MPLQKTKALLRVGATTKRCPENTEQIHRRTPALKCDPNKVA